MILGLKPDQIAIAVAGFLVGVFSNVIANMIAESSTTIKLVSFGLLILAAVVLFILRPVIMVRFGMQIPLREKEYARYARKGVIAFVPAHILYKVPREEQKSRQEYLKAAEGKDYLALDFERSSFQPLIEAISLHSARLEHCWLISTSGEHGSRRYVEALIEYLKNEKGLAHCQFHNPDQTMIEPNDDEALIRKVRDIIDQIYRDAKKEHRLEAKDIIADFTNGLRSTSTGMILSCLDGVRDVQFMGSHYDENGRPTGDLLPMLFKFEAQFINRMELP